MVRPTYLKVSNSELTVRVDVFKVSKIVKALFLIAFDRFRISRNNQDLVFFRLLGTGTGRTFTTKDADLSRWVIFTVWQNQAAAAQFNDHLVWKSWNRITTESASFLLAPLSSKGEWGGKEPFGNPIAHRWDGPVLSVTRARIKAHMWRRFQSEVPPVSKSLHASAGLVTAFGIGEAPIGLQGTVSVWKSNRELTEFAQRTQSHRDVIKKTHELDWYSEELFARFAIIEAQGILDSVPLGQSLN
jgi:hypothetical protein